MITKRREFFPFMRLVPLNVRIKEGNELNDFILHFFFSRSTLFMLYIHAKRLHHKKEIIKVWDICILRRFVIFCDLFVSIDAIALIYWVFSECDLLHLHNKRENWTFNNLTATNRLLELFFFELLECGFGSLFVLGWFFGISWFYGSFKYALRWNTCWEYANGHLIFKLFEQLHGANFPFYSCKPLP